MEYIIFVAFAVLLFATIIIKGYLDYKKQEKLRITAEIYLSEYPTELQPRFDVIEIYAPRGMDTREIQITHWEDAF